MDRGHPLPMMLLGLVMAACVPAQAVRTAGIASPQRAATVEVSNQNWADVTVYAVQTGVRQRLGTVTSMSTTVFRVPPTMAAGTGELRLVIDLLGSRQVHVTEPFFIGPGQRAVLRVQNHLAISSLSVWQP